MENTNDFFIPEPDLCYGSTTWMYGAHLSRVEDLVIVVAFLLVEVGVDLTVLPEWLLVFLG